MTGRLQLARHLNVLRQAKVLCVGDLMLDRFVYGTVHRVSPEAPIPVLRVGRNVAMLGGAGNVVRNLKTLGASSIFVSVVGNDAAGRSLAEMVGMLDGVEAHLLTHPSRASTIKTRYIAGGQQLLRADEETVLPLELAIATELACIAQAAVTKCNVVVISDYGKGVVTEQITGVVFDQARALGRPVIIDPKGTDFDRYRGASILTPNRGELAAALRMSVDSDAEIEAAARILIERLNLEAILVTRSGDGISLITASMAHHIPTQAREVYDVSGAGDTVAAVFAAALSVNVPLPDAVELANTAAGLVVAKLGTAAICHTDLERALRSSETGLGESKIVGTQAAADIVRQWSSNGERVGLTNGCFDLLHPGHLSLLRQAKVKCDRLVVAINSDTSVALLKGDDRPVQTETARAMVLAALSVVDLVVIFAEETPEALIITLQPDVLVKGADYTKDQVVGASFVESYGGSVVLVDLEPGFSTSQTIHQFSS